MTPTYAAYPLFFRYRNPPLPVPGGVSSYRLETGAPSGSLPAVLAVSAVKNVPVSFATFMTVPTATDELAGAVTVHANLSANQVMNGCATIAATIVRVQSNGQPASLGTAQLAGQVIPQGSGGGTAGYASFAIPIDVAGTGRSIAAGEGIGVSLTILNGCSANRSVSLAFDSVGALTRVEPAVVEVFGASGTFGSTGTFTPTGHRIGKAVVPNWAFDPGQAAFFSTVSEDGTVFLANMAQTFAPLNATQCHQGVTCFNPATPVCFDDATQSVGNFANIHVPTFVDGQIVVPSGGCQPLMGVCSSGTCTAGEVGVACNPGLLGADCALKDQACGRDTSDVEAVGIGQAERIVFSTAHIAGTKGGASTAGNSPALGALRKMDGAWRVDGPSLRSALDLQQSSTAGALACPNGIATCTACRPCPGTSQCALPFTNHCFCTTDAECGPDYSCIGGRCQTAACASLNESARLPQSGHLVFTHYFGGLSVIDASGTVRAHYVYPPVPDPCVANANVTLLPRQVEVDPTSSLGDERFVVMVDAGQQDQGQPVQEFSYDDTTATIVPVSAQVFPSSGRNPAPSCSGPREVTRAYYDHLGNLWVSRSVGIAGGPVAIYAKDPTTGQRRLETSCGYIDSMTSAPRQWGVPCAADIETGIATFVAGQPAQANWTVPWHAGGVADASSSAMILTSFGGHVLPFRVGPTTLSPIALGGHVTVGSHLLPAAADEGLPSVRKSSIDPARRAVWMPVSTSETVSGAVYQVGAVRNGWLFRVDIDRLVAEMVQASTVQAPQAITAGSAFQVSITSDIPTPLDGARSFLSVFVNDAASPAVPVSSWSTQCGGTSCTHTGVVPGSATSGTTGVLVWHAFFGAGSRNLHVVGRATVQP